MDKVDKAIERLKLGSDMSLRYYITEKGCKKLHRNYCKKCGQRILWED